MRRDLELRDVALVLELDTNAIGHSIEIVEMRTSQNDVQDLRIGKSYSAQPLDVTFYQQPGNLGQFLDKFEHAEVPLGKLRLTEVGFDLGGKFRVVRGGTQKLCVS